VSAHAHDHRHVVRADADRGRLWIALALIAGFMAVEVVAGILASSLALLADAAHMLTDAAAIALAIAAARLARRPPGGAMTFGMGRVEIFSAQVNGATLGGLGLLIGYESVRRLLDPAGVEGGLVLGVAVAGVAVNLVAARVLAGAGRESLNVEGSYQHVLTDLYAFAATAVAGGVILATGFDRADPLASLVVAALMLRSAWGLLRASGRVFLEAAPEGVDPEAIGHELARQPGVEEVHDLHVWEVTSGFPALSAHVVVGTDADCHATRADLERLLAERFDLRHTTLQVEHAPRRLLSIEGPESG
jgi:cobalt-zinc-cadmium efflux system protein